MRQWSDKHMGWVVVLASLTTFNCPPSSAGAESWRSRLPSDFQEELRWRSRNETVPPADTPTTSHASDVPSNSPFGPGMHLIIGPCQALARSFLLRMLSLSRLTKKNKIHHPAILCQSQFILLHKSFQWGQPVHHFPSHDALLYISLRVGTLSINRWMHTATVGVADLMG